MSSCSVTPQASPLAANLIQVSPSDATPCLNVSGAPGLLYTVDIDNAGNPATDHYVKLYDDLAPTVGTSEPTWVFKVDAGQRKQYVIPMGVPFTVGLSVATVTTPGMTGTVSPAATVSVWIATS